MKNDRFLTGILVFIGMLVVASVALFFFRNRTPVYGLEDSPEGVVYNYTVALTLRDYQRAWSYLVENEGRPTFAAFQQAFLIRQIDPGAAALQVGRAQILPDGSAWVSLTVQYPGSGIFNNGSSSTDKATLVRQNGAWKITYLPYPFWGFDWYTPTLVKQP